MTKKEIDVIADNGGGLTLQVHGRKPYLHSYDRADLLAENLRAIARGADPANDWEGNEYPETALDVYSYDVERTGGYHWWHGSAKKIIAEILALGDDLSAHNVQDLKAALKTK